MMHQKSAGRIIYEPVFIGRDSPDIVSVFYQLFLYADSTADLDSTFAAAVFLVWQYT